MSRQCALVACSGQGKGATSGQRLVVNVRHRRLKAGYLKQRGDAAIQDGNFRQAWER